MTTDDNTKLDDARFAEKMVNALQDAMIDGGATTNSVTIDGINVTWKSGAELQQAYNFWVTRRDRLTKRRKRFKSANISGANQ